MAKEKKNTTTYTLKICFNPDTDEIEYIAEGLDDNIDFSPITPYNIDYDYTSLITSEDMELIKEVYDIEDC